MVRFYDPSFVYSGKDNNFLETEASNIDLTDATYWYCGYISPRSGSWAIKRIHFIGDAMIFEYAFGRQRTDYEAHWDANGLYVVGASPLTYTTIDQAVPV